MIVCVHTLLFWKVSQGLTLAPLITFNESHGVTLRSVVKLLDTLQYNGCKVSNSLDSFPIVVSLQTCKQALDFYQRWVAFNQQSTCKEDVNLRHLSVVNHKEDTNHHRMWRQLRIVLVSLVNLVHGTHKLGRWSLSLRYLREFVVANTAFISLSIGSVKNKKSVRQDLCLVTSFHSKPSAFGSTEFDLPPRIVPRLRCYEMP